MIEVKVLSFLLFFGLVSSQLPKMVEDNISSCYEEIWSNKTTEYDVEEIFKKTDPEKVPEPFLCFEKCVSEKQGYICKKGYVQMDKIKNCRVLTQFIKDKDGFVDCLKDVKQIVECKDMVPVHGCIQKFITDKAIN